MLWAVFTLIAAAAQTARNAMQRELTSTLGTVGATQVRFLFGFPFAILFLIGVCTVTESGLPSPSLAYWPWILLGAGGQIVATTLMLAAMNDRSFVVTTAYIKTEPVQTAIFGLALLGDKLTPMLAVAIVIGVLGMGRQLSGLVPRIAAAAIVGGAIGNLLDRLLRDGSGFLGGPVVDFVDLQWWPVFNVADMAITCGAVALALTAGREKAA